MPSDRPNAEALFHQALEFQSRERVLFLASASAGDTTLRRRVDALLAAHEHAAGFLPENGALGSAILTGETPLTESVGTLIGRYKLLEKLGEGGFGIVWAAEQREPIRRRVALKIIKLGMDTKQVIARFEAERQALALMDHPNIAKVLDAGATETGRPYFVMELVRGIPITQYCTQENLATRARLDLFIKVCHAIQHAHQKGITHRDIKPSNILVTLHDGVPVPKVIDFGIAKATQAELTEKTIYTEFHHFIGTPAYMSPEQAEMSGLDIDTRSDIYSLGVLLYELLTGKTPFDGKALLQAGLDEMRRIIREKEPERPSTRLRRETADASRLNGPHASGMHSSTSHLSLSTDLDWIVMKCLEKDRARRYETANGLAMDLTRHLKDETIIARPPSTAYRLQKAWHRNRLAFTSAMLIVAALLTGLGLSIWQALIANNARQKAEEATALAVQREGTIARNVYFTEMILAGHAALVSDGISRIAEITEKWRPKTGAVDQRGWEWYYLRSLLHSDLFTLNGHTSGVLSVAWSPDGKHLASGSEDGTVKIWNVGTGKNTFTLRGHTATVLAIAWNPDGTRLASGGEDETIQVWDPKGAKEAVTLVRRSGWVHTLAWSPDGTLIASGSGDRDRTIKIWNAESGEQIQTLVGHDRWVSALAWSPDGKNFASASGDNSVRIWDPVTGAELRIFRDHPHPFAVHSVAWSPDGKRLVSGGNDHRVVVRDLETGNTFVLAKHTQHVRSLAWSMDGKRVASASDDRTVQILDVESRTNILTLRGHTDGVNSVHWSPDGKRVVSGSWDDSIKVWDVTGEDSSVLRGHTNEVFSVAWSPDGRRLASGDATGAVKLWDARTRTNIQTLNGHADCVFSLVWSQDGQRLASGSFDKRVMLWDAGGHTNILSFGEHNAGIFSVAWSPDGKYLASSSWHQLTFDLWESESGKVIHKFAGHSNNVFSLAWSPNGERIASASWDNTVKIWDLDSRQVIHTLGGHKDVARSVAWSPDGNRLVSGSRDHTIKIWDAVRGTYIRTLHGHTSEVVLALWSPDGKRIASGSFDGSVRVWEPESGQETLALHGHTSQVQSIAWSPDGEQLASASRDRTIRIWDARKGYALEAP